MAIDPPDDVTRELYDAQTETVRNKLGYLELLGKLICKVWYAESCDKWDLPTDKYPSGRPYKVDQDQDYEFWVEERVLNECFIGMKMDASIITLEGDITILDEVKQMHCGFYTWLPNELWMDNKPKEVRWLAKGLPDYEENVWTAGVNKHGQEK